MRRDSTREKKSPHLSTSFWYSHGHLLVITGYKWDYTFYKWGYKYLELVKGLNCMICNLGRKNQISPKIFPLHPSSQAMFKNPKCPNMARDSQLKLGSTRTEIINQCNRARTRFRRPIDTGYISIYGAQNHMI